MKSVNLAKGYCAICGEEIAAEWNPRPTWGDLCATCLDKPPAEKRLFKPENILLQSKTHIVYDPLFGIWQLEYDFTGTLVMINGQTYPIVYTDLSAAHVKFQKTQPSETVVGLSYFHLLELYQEKGNQLELDGPTFAPYVPRRADLLDSMICPLQVGCDESGLLSRVSIGEEGNRPDFKAFWMLHAFCNMYIRQRYNLAPNYAMNGGFIGYDFAVRNMGGNPSYGLLIDPKFNSKAHYQPLLELASQFDALSGNSDNSYARVAADLDALNEFVSIEPVIADWVVLMSYLLRYNWREVPYETPAEIWEAFCTLQNVARNLLDNEEIEATLKYALAHKKQYQSAGF